MAVSLRSSIAKRRSHLNAALNSWRINGTRNCTIDDFLDSVILFYLAYRVLSSDG
ncbi:hypothetical protein I7096_005003 [Vibrio parahaemolyticus]|nr:hypothetical protein [Vibrio parahaemolyticus]